MSRPVYIAVEGPIGVGKTTLVARLAQRMQARQVLEVVEENPFLSKFYADRDRFAFQTQIFFLMSRFRQQAELRQPELFGPHILTDYHLLKDRIFARLTLADDELALYERVYRSLQAQILKPDVLIYLHAPLDCLLQRIAQRGRPFERDFDTDYLTQVSRAYAQFFRVYDETPVLTVDNADLNYASHTDEAQDVITRILGNALRLAGRDSDDLPRPACA